MNRTLTVVALLMLTSGMGSTEKAGAEPLPDTCTMLEAVDAAALFGQPLTFSPNAPLTRVVEGVASVSGCDSETADGGFGPSLLVRQSLAEEFNETAEEVREAHLASVAGEADGGFTDVDLGLALPGAWMAGSGQLTFWFHGGRTLVILTDYPDGDAEKMAAIGRALAETFGAP
ncbi:MAG: hypothetical protein AAFY59_01850 [Pseudomonadota bacterium]